MIPYGRQQIDERDIEAVVQVLKSDWLTTGPKVEEFEMAVASFVGAKHAVAVSNGTAALHAAMFALGIGPGDEVIVPPMTFLATANSVVFQGGTPVFADVDPGALLINPDEVERRITPKTKAILAVDYAGQPCNYKRLQTLARQHGLHLVTDACHALGAEYKGKKIGSIADMTVFSFHPVKHITTGEGGMITTDDPELAVRMRRFRNHGIATDFHQREKAGSWFYEMVDLGYNYRITDIQCALGISQLAKFPGWLDRRRQIARQYDAAFFGSDGIVPLAVSADVKHAYHLYVVKLGARTRTKSRAEAFAEFRRRGIGVNVHYIPVQLHPFYRGRFGTGAGQCPVAESEYERIISLPMFSGLTDSEVDTVIRTAKDILG
jgi:perosamine synthetase